MFKVDNKDTGTWMTTMNDVVLVPLLSILNRFRLLFWCFHCWLWTCKCRVELSQWFPVLCSKKQTNKKTNFLLNLSWRPLSYRNQFIYLQRKSVEWFLYDRNLRRERVKDFILKSEQILKKQKNKEIFW